MPDTGHCQNDKAPQRNRDDPAEKGPTPADLRLQFEGENDIDDAGCDEVGREDEGQGTEPALWRCEHGDTDHH